MLATGAGGTAGGDRRQATSSDPTPRCAAGRHLDGIGTFHPSRPFELFTLRRLDGDLTCRFLALSGKTRKEQISSLLEYRRVYEVHLPLLGSGCRCRPRLGHSPLGVQRQSGTFGIRSTFCQPSATHDHQVAAAGQRLGDK